VRAVRRRAKYIIIDLSPSEDCLVLHLGMSGSIRISGKSAQPEKRPHDHMEIDFRSGKRLIFNDPRRFGAVYLIPAPALDRHKAFVHLGPEPLEDGFSAAGLHARLKGRTMPIKQAIMDQSIVVGVGNIYACEALFRAGIRPTLAAGRVSLKRLEALAGHICAVLAEAIAAGGSSLRDHRRVDGDMGYFQHSFGVYDRAGEACPGCDCKPSRTGGIKRIVQGGRSTFYCPRKQS
jgi:formamidopyrimidine-DNA glycosylase